MASRITALQFGRRTVRRMKRVQAVGFDLDGTLFDHRGSATEAIDAFICYLGGEPSALVRKMWFAEEKVQFERWRSGELTFQGQRRARLKSVLPRLGLPVPDADSNLDLLFEKYLNAYRSAWRPFPDSAATLNELRHAGMRIGVLTNGNEDQQVDKLRSIGLYDLLDVVCVSESLGMHKPDRRAFEVLSDRLGVMPKECVFVGDNPEQDVAGALSAGMQALLVDRYGLDRAGIITKVRAVTGIR